MDEKKRKKYIKQFCRALEVFWIKVPTLRFSQLLSYFGYLLRVDDSFYIEDDELYNLMDKIINKGEL